MNQQYISLTGIDWTIPWLPIYTNTRDSLARLERKMPTASTCNAWPTPAPFCCATVAT